MKIIQVILLLFCCMATVAQPKAKPKPEAVPENTLLWEISGNDWKTPSYLFGTMHLLCEDDAKLSDSLQYCITQAKKVYFEIDMDNMAEMMGLLRYIRMNDNKKLSDLLTEDDYRKVKDYFKAHPSLLPFTMMERFKPFFITVFMQQQEMPCEKQDGMESVIMKLAKKQGKEIKGLETIKFQASVFDSIPYSLQAKELVKYIDSAGKDNHSAAALMQVYRDQDLGRMLEMTVKEEGMIGNSLDLMLFLRNARWVEGIDTIGKNGSMLFAVGAAHLPGDKGVITLLRKKGYRVRPMLHELRSGELARQDD